MPSPVPCSPTARRELLEEVLPFVEKPSRYLGTEHNAVHKPREAVELRLALVFPDLYDLGLGNLGIHILYAILNEEFPWCWCERAYAPAPDLARELRARGLPLFAWESKDPLGSLHGVGFTLQSELTYTTILEILDLSGIPLRTADRGEEHPLTFAGGPAVFNPEPLAPFMDFFVIGDGEDAVRELAVLLRALRQRGASRQQTLEAIARLEGFYVPALHPMEVLPDGSVRPPVDGPRVRKRITRDLDGERFPVNYIVPFTEQVHDRISLEVLRGCTQGCRFCQAGMTTRPVRERTLEGVDRLMERTLASTGYEEVSLVSLSTCDHSRVKTLVDNAVKRAMADGDRVSVSLPSLRLDSFSVDLADRVSDVRRTGLTFAPEAASPRLRALINKWIPDEDLLDMAGSAYAKGWKHVKLYFMIGLPTERDDDVEAIADLTLRTVRRGREVQRALREAGHQLDQKASASVNTGVSTFVPKPFTPFQWAEQIGPAETERRQGILQERFRGAGGVKFGRHEPDETFLEGLVTRGDRRCADLIEAAWRHGAVLDAWREHRNMGAWERAVHETGFDVADALRERDVSERLPWDHIDVLIPKAWFVEDWVRATELRHAKDCRHSKCHDCGVIDEERPLCAHMLRTAIAGAKAEQDVTYDDRPARDPARANQEPDQLPVQRLRLRVARHGEVRLLSHLETMNAWLRALRRARAPVAWSGGFHPHPRVQFAGAFPHGEETAGDLMEVLLRRRVEPAALLEALRATLPPGLGVVSVEEVELRGPALSTLLDGHVWRLYPVGVERAALEARVAEVLAADEVGLVRKIKQRGRKVDAEVNVRPYIERLHLLPGDPAVVELASRVVEGRMARPRDLLALLGADGERSRVLKVHTRLRSAEALAGVVAEPG